MKSTLALILLLTRTASGRIANPWRSNAQYGVLQTVISTPEVQHDDLNQADLLGKKLDYAYANPSFSNDGEDDVDIYVIDPVGVRAFSNDLKQPDIKESPQVFEKRLLQLAADIAAKTGSTFLSISPSTSYKTNRS